MGSTGKQEESAGREDLQAKGTVATPPYKSKKGGGWEKHQQKWAGGGSRQIKQKKQWEQQNPRQQAGRKQ